MAALFFKKCRISNAMDGTEADMLFDKGEIACADNNDKVATDEKDIYNEKITAEQFRELFRDSSNEQQECLGFSNW